MNSALKLTLAATLALVGTSMFVACGGDSSSSGDNKGTEISEYEKLPSCTTKNDAERATVDGDEKVYVCKDRRWEILDTSFVANDTAKTLDDIPNCADEQDGNSYYIKESGVNYICENDRWEIVVVKKDDPKSSASTAKSSASTAKSSASTVKSSASTAKSSSSTVKGSSSSKAENDAATLDDLPNCTARFLDDVYYVSAEKTDFICTENRTWEKVLSCGKNVYGSESYFCAGGKAYEKCGGKTYDPAKKFCNNGKVIDLCGGKPYNPEVTTCVDGKAAYLSCDVSMGDFVIYTDGESVFFERSATGDFMNGEGGCLYQAENERVELEMMRAKFLSMTKDEMQVFMGPNYLMGLLLLGNFEIDESNCDYDYTWKMSRKFDDAFTEAEVLFSVVALKSGLCSEHEYDEGDWKVCRDPSSSAKSTMTDIEKQFCYRGVTYDRCGGSTFATSKAYNPTLYSCVDGKVVGKSEGTICGGKEFDPVYQRCESGVIVRNIKNESSVTNAYGYEKVYSVGDSAYSDLIMFGEVLDNKETGCYDFGVNLVAAINETAEIVLPDPVYSKEMRNFFAYGKAEFFMDSCDYYVRYTRKVKIPEGYSFEEFKTGSNEFYAAMLNEPNVKYGLYEPSPDGKIMCGEDAAATVMDAEKQFCSKGIVYDRCGGSSFASSVIFYPEIQSCVGGEVVAGAAKPLCGAESYDPKNTLCVGGKLYDKGLYEQCSETVVAKKSSEFCFEGSAYASSVYGKCGDYVYKKSEAFCSADNKVVELCGGETYDPSAEFCFEDVAYPLCGGKSYIPQDGGSCSNGNYYYSDGLTKYFQDMRDGNVYPYVNVGTQTWLAKNLNYAVENSKCNGGNCSEFGRYYTWADAMNDDACTNSTRCSNSDPRQGVCPDGWHIPSASEAQSLVETIGEDLTKYRSTSGWNTSVTSSKGNGTNEYGLNLLPSDRITSGSAISSSGWNSYFWTTTQRPKDVISKQDYGTIQAQAAYAWAGSNQLTIEITVPKDHYLSVRCIKN